MAEISIHYDREKDKITVKKNGVPVAWGGFFYERDLANTFRQYLVSDGKPDCATCGHEYMKHLDYGSVTPRPNTGRWNGCHWGGGLEGWCDCAEYVPKEQPEVSS